MDYSAKIDEINRRHKEEIAKVKYAEYQHNYYVNVKNNNPEYMAKQAEISRKWNEAHRERVKENAHRWYEAHKEHAIAKKREWAKKNPEKIKLYQKISAAKRLLIANGYTVEKVKK